MLHCCSIGMHPRGPHAMESRVSGGGANGTAGATAKGTYLGPCIEMVLGFQPAVTIWLRDLKLDDCGW